MTKKLTLFSFILIFTFIFAGCSNNKEDAAKKMGNFLFIQPFSHSLTLQKKSVVIM